MSNIKQEDQKEQEKLKYLIIKNWIVKKWSLKSKEFSWSSESYPKNLIYQWDNYRIYDHDKNKVLPLVKLLIEDFTPQRDIFVVICVCISFILLIICFISYNKVNKINDQLALTTTTINTVWNWIKEVKTDIIKQKEQTTNTREKTVIEEVMQKNNIPTWIKEDSNTKINNENEQLRQNNLSLQMELEKYKFIASQEKPDNLKIYNQIKEEFYKTEKERIQKEVELEYIKWKEFEFKEEYKESVRQEVEKEVQEKYKKILLENCNLWAEKVTK